MRTLFTSLCLGLCFVSLAACGSEPEETGSAEGEPCASASDCNSGLLCFVTVDGEDGECQPIPSACGEEATCSSDCIDEVKAQCTSGGSSCISVGKSNVTVTCLGGA
jgi:hypothetical protein